MRISGQDTVNNPIRPNQPVQESDAVSRVTPPANPNATENSGADRVELSTEARAIQKAQEVAQNAPEIRQDRVEAARRALENGTLPLDGATLADKLLQQFGQG